MWLTSPEIPDNNAEMDLREILHGLLCRWRAILLAVLAGALLAGIYWAAMIPPSYMAEASLYIATKNTANSYADIQFSAAMTKDYISVMKSGEILKTVIDELGLDMDAGQLSERVTVTNPKDTHIIAIAVTGSDPESIRVITDAFLEISTEKSSRILGIRSPTVLDRGQDVHNVTPGVNKYLVLGAFGGIFFSCAIIVARMLLDNTIKTGEDVERYLQIPVLSCVPYDPRNN